MGAYGKVDQNQLITQLGWVTFDESCQATSNIPQPVDNDAFETFQNLCEMWGYTFASYQAFTEDGWTLTLFRITGLEGETPREYDSNSEPILFQHSALADAQVTLFLGLVGKPWILSLFDEGYDVWLGNNRGTKYSN